MNLINNTLNEIKFKRKNIDELQKNILQLKKQIDEELERGRHDDPSITYLNAVRELDAQNGKNHLYPDKLQINDYLKLPPNEQERVNIINILLSRELTIECDYDVANWYRVKRDEEGRCKKMTPQEIIDEQIERRKLFLLCDTINRLR